MCGEGENGCVERGRMNVWRRGEWVCGEGENGCVEKGRIGVWRRGEWMCGDGERMDSRCVGVKNNVCM